MSGGTRAIGGLAPAPATGRNRKARLLGGAAFVGVLAVLAGTSNSAYAACAGVNTASVLCDAANQATAGTLNTTFAGTTVVNVNPGGKIDTGGATATLTAAGSLTFNHNDTTFGITNAGGSGVRLTNNFGNVTYTGGANVTAGGFGIATTVTSGLATINLTGGTVVASNGISAASATINGHAVVTIAAGATSKASGLGAGLVLFQNATNTVVNDGTISGGAGIQIFTSTTNTITNNGTISSAGFGVQTSDGTTTLTNRGTITGAFSALLLAGANNLFIMEGPSATMTGRAFGSGTDTFRLAGSGANTFNVRQISAGWTLFEKTGASTWTLTDTAIYTGPTNVNQGTLLVNGSLASSSGMTVATGATVGGTGILPTTTVNGTLSPGNSIGVITVNGNLTFAGAGNYLVEVSPTDADRTNVTGVANLAGTVQAVFQPGAYVARSYTILHANGGLNGQFNTVTTAGFGATLSYTATDVILSLTAQLGLGTQLNGNQTNVANAINNAFNGGSALPPAFLPLFGLTGTPLASALTRLSGEIGTGAATAGVQATGQFLGLMLDPFLENRAGGAAAGFGGPALSFAPDDEATSALALANGLPRKAPPLPPAFEQRWSVWGAAYGGHGAFDGDPLVGSNNLSASTAGVAGGVDYRFGTSVIGAAVTGQSLKYGLDGGLGSGDGDAVQGGLYGSTKWGHAYVSAAVSFGWYDLDTTRVASIAPGFSNVLTGDVSADSLGGRIEGGYRFPVLQSSGVTPYAALQAIRFHTDAYTETGAAGGNAFALTYGANTTNDLRSELGLRVDHRMMVSEASLLILRGRAAWAHGFDPDRAVNAFFVTLPAAGFTVFGATPAENSALLSAGAELRLANGFSVLAKFDGEFGDDTTVYAGSGTLRYSW